MPRAQQYLLQEQVLLDLPNLEKALRKKLWADFSFPKLDDSQYGGPGIARNQRRTKGVENLREGKTYHKTPPQKRFWTPPPLKRFPPPLVHALSFALERMGTDQSHFLSHPKPILGALYGMFPPLDGRNRAIVIAESLARVIAAIRTSLAFVGAHISPQNTGLGPHRPCVCCVAIRIARLAFTGVVFVPRGFAEWPARVGRVR